MRMLSAKKKLSLNTLMSILLQVTTVICGFILPRLILGRFGSSVNGLTSSITQFLSLISFLELGLGAVIPAALYKPLAEHNEHEISAIVTSGSKFFKRVALILLFYIFGLMAFYPVFVNQEFDWLYTAALIAVIGIRSFAQYYFGIIDRLLLTADQRGYIQYASQIIALIASTVLCAILIQLGASIHLVKLLTSFVFLIQPLALRAYVNKYYRIDRHCQYDREPIKQKWNGIAQHIAAVVLDNTDVVILTLFSTLSNVSIYSVYNMVAYGVKNLVRSTINGVQALIGELWAKQDLERLQRVFSALEFTLHTFVVLIFTCTGLLILPFIQVYTKGITDADYFQPAFAILLTAAHAGHCLRLPYHISIMAAGHFKQTQTNYILAAGMNVVISLISVWKFGLVGVAFGTLVAMLYQTAWMAVYDSKHLIRFPLKNTLKQFGFDALLVCAIVLGTRWFKMSSLTYLSWFLLAVKVFAVAVVITAAMSLLFYRKQVKYIIAHFFSK